MSRLPARKQRYVGGFTLVEVMVAIFVLTVGVLGVASLATNMLATGSRSKFMTLASTLASEKLEDLNRWDVDDPQVCVPSGNATAGSLTTDLLQTTACPPNGLGAINSASVAYYDDVSIGLTNAGGDCQITAVSSNNAPSNATFHRRWVIEANTPANGMRRLTVLVSGKGQPNVNFQMSVVRP